MLVKLRAMGVPAVEILGSQPVVKMCYCSAQAEGRILSSGKNFRDVPVVAMGSGHRVVAFGHGEGTTAVMYESFNVFGNGGAHRSLISAFDRLKSLLVALHAIQFGLARSANRVRKVRLLNWASANGKLLPGAAQPAVSKTVLVSHRRQTYEDGIRPNRGYRT